MITEIRVMIWQVAQEQLTKEPLQIVGGCVEVPTRPGLGIDVAFAALERTHELDNRPPAAGRGDAVAMQHLVPGWRFDPKRLALVR